MPTYVHVYIDPQQLNRIQWLFKDYPKSIGRILKESVNRAAEKARTDIVTAGSKLTKIRKRIVRRFTSIKKATDKNWTASVRAWSRGIPISYLDINFGTPRKIYKRTTLKQSIWLYHHVFKEKYGDNAIFSRQYSIRQKVWEGITYKVGRKTISPPQGSFVAKMKTGHIGVFQRKTNSPGIREVVGPSIGQILMENKIEVKTIQDNAFNNLSMDIASRVGRYLKMRDTGTLPGYKTA
jgi:hypothetical protein